MTALAHSVLQLPRFAAKRRTGILARLVFFMIPFAFFLDPANPYFVYSIVGFEQQVTGYPVSLLLLPVIALVSLGRLTERSVSVLHFTILVGAIIVFSSVYYGTIEPFLFGSLWLMPMFWLMYLMSTEIDLQNPAILKSFCWGFIISTAYLDLGGVLETVLYGGLLESGRMSSNLVLPGQYQLYIYMPTLISLSSLVCIGVIRSGCSLFRGDIVVIICLTLAALFFAAAREAILTFAVGLAALMLCTTRLRLFLFVFASVVGGVLLTIYSDDLLSWAAASDYGAIKKFAQFQEADQQFGGRDLAVAQYLEIFLRNPLIGTGFRSPFDNYFGTVVNFPSAHNFYADTLAWGGIGVALLYFGLTILAIIKASANYLASLTMPPREAALVRAFSVALVLALVISNNINVPMRQPLMAPIFALLIYGAFFFARVRAEAAAER